MNEEVRKLGPYGPVQVQNFLPHRYPFLFVDKILQVDVPYADGKPQAVGVKIVGVKNATYNEPYFVGHFPGMPITPGVILIETIAQISSFALIPFMQVSEDMKILGQFDLRLAGVENTRFRRPFLPGDTLTVKSEVIKQRGLLWWFKAIGEIEGNAAVECEFLAAITLGGKS